MKDDREFGVWISTTAINNKVWVRQFDTGFIIKIRGEDIVQRIKYVRPTTSKDVSEIINEVRKR